MLTASVPLATAAVMTGTTVVTGVSQQITNQMLLSIQCVWTGTPTGTFKVQACNDALTPTSSSTWTDLGTSAIIVNGSQPAGSASSLLLISAALGIPYGWVRLIYTNASGTGTFNAQLFIKGY